MKLKRISFLVKLGQKNAIIKKIKPFLLFNIIIFGKHNNNLRIQINFNVLCAIKIQWVSII
jgi:hypothetical protein